MTTPARKPRTSADLLETLLGPAPSAPPAPVQIHVAAGAQIVLMFGNAQQLPTPSLPGGTEEPR